MIHFHKSVNRFVSLIALAVDCCDDCGDSESDDDDSDSIALKTKKIKQTQRIEQTEQASTLDLASFQLEDKHSRAVSALIKANTDKFNCVDLSHNFISAEGFRDICDSLSFQSHWQQIKFRGNQIGDEGCALLRYSLNNIAIDFLDLGLNGISFQGIVDLSFSFHTSLFNLKQLNLQQNAVDDLCCVPLSFALRTSVVSSLNVSSNKIGDLGSSFFANLFRNNFKLTNLNISTNLITLSGLSRLTKSVHSNPAVVAVDASYNLIDRVSLKLTAFEKRMIFQENFVSSRVLPSTPTKPAQTQTPTIQQSPNLRRNNTPNISETTKSELLSTTTATASATITITTTAPNRQRFGGLNTKMSNIVETEVAFSHSSQH